MKPPREQRWRRCTAMAPPPAEDRANFERLAPFRADEPCVCGSHERTRNTDGAVFCRRCSREYGKPLPSVTALR